MSIYVCVKQVPDTEARIAPQGEGAIREEGIKWVMNPYDELAVEEALRLKEAQNNGEVIVVSLGPERAQEAIRMALAMGADRALHVVSDEYLDHRLVAKALAGAIQSDGTPTMVFAGRQAIDDDGFQVHLRLAHLLGITAATDVREFAYDETGVSVTREIEEGALEKLTLAAPAMVAVARGINTPRYPTLPNIMKAKRKEIKQLSLSDVGVAEVVNHEAILDLTAPPEKAQGRILEGEHAETVPELVRLLHDEAKAV